MDKETLDKLNLTLEEYTEQAKEYIKNHPKYAEGFYGNWAVYVKLLNEFDKTLKKKIKKS